MSKAAPKKRKALVLLSGGLDSQLAICVLQEQGIHVEAITYSSPFFDYAKGEQAAAGLGVKLHVIDFTDDILDLVQNPPHGLGKAMNPCIDCHTRMIYRAGKLMEEWGFDFIATGEVMGQRPMSQNKQSLGVVARCSEYEDRLVRPLCAALLSPTLPVREGWIDAGKLPALSGRNRTPQMALAEKFGIVEYPAPAGGCLLTEKQFGWKLKDVFDHEGIDEDQTNMWLLKTGRHLRLSEYTKIIVGADRQQNELLDQKAHKKDLRLSCINIPGPLAIVPENASKEEIKTAASIVARYSDTPSDEPVDVSIKNNKTTTTISVTPMSPEQVEQYRIRG